MPLKPKANIPLIVTEQWSDEESGKFNPNESDTYYSPVEPSNSEGSPDSDVTARHDNSGNDHNKGQNSSNTSPISPSLADKKTATRTPITAPTMNTNASGTPILDDMMDVDPPQFQPDLDLLPKINGMFRLLDLISESASGGLVSKIIIAQESLKELINELSPGAYSSMIKVNFKALDKILIKPLGIYGSQSEIVDFMITVGAIDEEISRALLRPQSDTTPHLRSGLYVLHTSHAARPDSEQLFVIYWPEPTTWDDDAISSVRRNRVTFLRYLTKISDQVVCLVSPEHAQSIVWHDSNESEVMEMDLEDESTDRLFTFAVAKTNEQEEDVTIRPGFQINIPVLAASPRPNDCPVEEADLQPMLISGETAMAILTRSFLPGEYKERQIRDESYNPTQLRSLLSTGTIRFTSKVSDEGVQILGEHGLQSRAGNLFGEWKTRNDDGVRAIDDGSKQELQDALKKLRDDEPTLEPVIKEAVVDQLTQMFPTIPRTTLSPVSQDELELRRTQFTSLIAVHPDIKDEIGKFGTSGARTSEKFEHLKSVDFRAIVDQILGLECLFAERPELPIPERERIVEHVTQNGFEGLTELYGLKVKDGKDEKSSPLYKFVASLFSSPEDHRSTERKVRDRIQSRKKRLADGVFLASLDDISNKEPLLRSLCVKALDIAQEYLPMVLPATVRHCLGRAAFVQETAIKKQIQRKTAVLKDELLKDSRKHFAEEYENICPNSDPTLIVDKIERIGQRFTAPLFKISGTFRTLMKPVLRCKLYPLQLTTDDQHKAQLESNFVPTPHQSRDVQTFDLSLDSRILHAQLLEKERLLMVLVDTERLCIYHEPLSAIHHAISRGRDGAKRAIYRDKIGRDVIVAYDEQKKMLSVCSASNLLLHIYQFDETFAGLQAWASALDLRPWYPAGTALHKCCFIAGSEELLLVDNSRQARIFSLITQQFRPATLLLDQLPETLQSSPDGACLIVSARDSDKLTYRSFHWDTFGSSEGKYLDGIDYSSTAAIVTSMVNRRNVHLAGIDVESRVCCSVVLEIKKKVTEFMFKETGTKASFRAEQNETANNCLIEVHSEVWTRFPVFAAVQRQTVSSGTRRPRKLLFIADRDHNKYAPHFNDLIYGFEQRTRKPTGDILKSLEVASLSPLGFYNTLSTLMADEITIYKGGEWIVDLLCLIPIQIALTRDNRFLPLKDGVVSAALERSLLGAEVGQIVDSLSFGWFESVFQSYMTSKPVKVVSSMGEQSVGKSYTLNHLADTSFAGSAMRTTEGVWMSVTPTTDTLVVALDFEGVHSIERSAQEDTLLVLFNTALSNLVLFRNNFAMSRSITGLFQSFQSSSTVLDPAANPTLFKSTLTIIIKASEDVVETDKKEIVKEFSTKFQKIVEDEQDANFISRLHAGQLNILPWPVIESKQFYALFPVIKRLLDKQEVTHRTAGEFLHTLKTLMAKLKANDWGALSQNLAAHRAQKLLTGLNNALVFGFYEVDPEQEALKNFDTDELIDMPDTEAQFFLTDKESSASQREGILLALQRSWDQLNQRPYREETEWFNQLVDYLNTLVDMRISHVHKWISSNLSRFTESQANMEMLRRVFETSMVDLRANVELCGTQCSNCQLKCLLGGRHSQSLGHDCRTNHACTRSCDFGDDDHPVGERSKQCGLPAGHPGRHICAVDVHLCGEPCHLKDKPGCLGRCMKPAAHEGDVHQCTARVHKCGEPCRLKVKMVGGKTFTCTKTCSIPSDEAHTAHVCDSSACPIACELCKRLCSETDHLHGLDKNAVHLCGQSHPCSALCQSGICQVETVPQSIEATFTGRHETFQYTKYSQDFKRLPCVFNIPPGQKAHNGPHCHTTDPAPFHFCETRCENCGYFCTLPRGHPQQEHETRHGSMSRTQWAVDGPDGTIVEVNGHKFGANDEGSPLLCNLFCQEMGRHAHMDYCRADDANACTGNEVQHITTRMTPNPDRPKDWVSHSLFWRRSGMAAYFNSFFSLTLYFRLQRLLFLCFQRFSDVGIDPYSRPDQLNFTKCDAMCPGKEKVSSPITAMIETMTDTDHAGDATTAPKPSYCTLPLFHAPAAQGPGLVLGYLSNDGHVFNCKNPAVMQNAFHVIFVIDRSGSMGYTDRRPLANTPSTTLISQSSNNRLGAVYSALHAFWLSRNTALNGGNQGTAPVRRDAYSVILFDHAVSTCIANDFTSTPDKLLNLVLPYRTGGGTNFTAAIASAEALMETHWSTERTPVVIFLSDGECDIADETMRSLSRKAIAKGKPLSFHSVSFGRASQSGYLQRMAQVALEVQNSAPRDLTPTGATIPSSYSEALDTVRLAETFLGFAESLRKPRGALVGLK
ncbi:VWFA domain-containing protein [Mycena indigotica]|uniref:VWFA domain-containing protein n=1 Tax=Mycena indigotica TaxID=2126181 RepID=A0A8H6T1K6_9AGAR|nr:VWFA domain-containing protein [Mycena indigotica]KAF7309973.1 VWFA domain-containing protein [Mycena indigotica]